MQILGNVKELIEYEEESLQAILVECNGLEYIFYLTKTTQLIDEAGHPVPAESLVHRTAAIDCDEVMTLSLPPKSVALTVMVSDHTLAGEYSG